MGPWWSPKALAQPAAPAGGCFVPEFRVGSRRRRQRARRHPFAGRGTAARGRDPAIPAHCGGTGETGDPRRSIEKHYTSKEDYLERTRGAVTALVERRYLLDEDIEPILERAALRWNLFTAASQTTDRIPADRQDL